MHKSSEVSNNDVADKLAPKISSSDKLSLSTQTLGRTGSIGRKVADESAAKASGPVQDYLGLIGVQTPESSKLIAGGMIKSIVFNCIRVFNLFQVCIRMTKCCPTVRSGPQQRSVSSQVNIELRLKLFWSRNWAVMRRDRPSRDDRSIFRSMQGSKDRQSDPFRPSMRLIPAAPPGRT